MSYQSAQQASQQLTAGCSSIAWETNDNKHLWGRNYDYNTIAASDVIVMPRQYQYYTAGDYYDKNLDKHNLVNSKYAVTGVGTLGMKTTPLFYEGINEKGLMGGQLFYAGYAYFPQTVQPHTLPLNPGYAVTHILAQCATNDDVIKLLTKQVTCIDQALVGGKATVHWVFTDRSGESIIIEPDRTGIHIYRHTAGVMTNSPDYPWHKQNLLTYLNVQNDEFPDRNMNGITVKKPFKGTGALGLPGDFTSQSRFIRASFLKYFGVKGKDEAEGIAYLFRFLDNVAMPLGMVKVNDKHDLSAYDISIYSAAMCSESLRFYWRTYRDCKLYSIDLNKELDNQEIKTFPLHEDPEFTMMN
ncbi:MAG: linear amide C-N hydrolase [Candidatus Paralactobacillus gallistercoris]|uniref:Linear amide C-N hydrolase n=1 Tax=Candidatus Paralactobacillus gallistercoris TaxID=2838724 RepID=A0A948TJH2_9LACO|nr:linear amide C-N hydrolase [Candidatus Paralactobacillus gallistercoris]